MHCHEFYHHTATTWTPVQVITVIVSFISLLGTIGIFIVNRSIVWRKRYYDRWKELENLVINDKEQFAQFHPPEERIPQKESPNRVTTDPLYKLWCNSEVYARNFGDFGNDPQELRKIQFSSKQLVFGEMFLDFFYEVNSSDYINKLLLGEFPASVRIPNINIILIYYLFIRYEYSGDGMGKLDNMIYNDISSKLKFSELQDYKYHVMFLLKSGIIQDAKPPINEELRNKYVELKEKLQAQSTPDVSTQVKS